MGDRANVYVHEGDEPGVYLYTHWTGTELPETVRQALLRRVRWDDTAYLTRIVFDQMTEGQQGRELGYGISATLGDGADRVVDVDTALRRVTVHGRKTDFEDYVKSPQNWRD